MVLDLSSLRLWILVVGRAGLILVLDPLHLPPWIRVP